MKFHIYAFHVRYLSRNIVKVGYTDDLERRLSQLLALRIPHLPTTACFSGEYVHTESFDSQALAKRAERECQNALEAFRFVPPGYTASNGNRLEWFERAPDDVASVVRATCKQLKLDYLYNVLGLFPATIGRTH